ncbi:type II toxin-antitoxin system RelE/ParE family toxin [soil metagenome]
MEVIIKKSFIKALKLTPKEIQSRVLEIITEVLPGADNLETSGLDYSKMEGQKKDERYYRIRVGNYRMGVENFNPTIIIITILHRGTIYKKFPPQ